MTAGPNKALNPLPPTHAHSSSSSSLLAPGHPRALENQRNECEMC